MNLIMFCLLPRETELCKHENEIFNIVKNLLKF